MEVRNALFAILSTVIHSNRIVLSLILYTNVMFSRPWRTLGLRWVFVGLKLVGVHVN